MVTEDSNKPKQEVYHLVQLFNDSGVISQQSFESEDEAKKLYDLYAKLCNARGWHVVQFERTHTYDNPSTGVF